MILLDTDHVSLLQWGGPQAERILKRLEESGDDRAFPTTIITYEEQLRGWIGRFSSAKNVVQQVELYRKLHSQLEYFKTMRIFAFTEAAAVEFQKLRALRIRIGTMDLKIAAVALSNRATLLTRNIQDFSKVPGLPIEDASAEKI